jgi:hypothetical protein
MLPTRHPVSFPEVPLCVGSPSQHDTSDGRVQGRHTSFVIYTSSTLAAVACVASISLLIALAATP